MVFDAIGDYPPVRRSPGQGWNLADAGLNLLRKFQLLLQALHLERFEDAETILNTDLTQDPMDMVFYSLLGKVELAGDFLIGHPAINQGNQLLFAPRKPSCSRVRRFGDPTVRNAK